MDGGKQQPLIGVVDLDKVLFKLVGIRYSKTIIEDSACVTNGKHECLEIGQT